MTFQSVIKNGTTERDCCYVEVVIIGGGPQALTLAASLLEAQPYALDDAAQLTAKRRKGRHQRGDGPACKCGEVMVLDQEGEWLSGWRKNFDFLEIPTLRSPLLAHPDPRTELALLEACSLCKGGLRSSLGDDQYYGLSKAKGLDDEADLAQWNARIVGKDKKETVLYHIHEGSSRRHRHHCDGAGGGPRSFLEGLGFLYARPKSSVFMNLCDQVIQRYDLQDRLIPARAVSITRTGHRDLLIGLSDGSAIRAGRVVCCTGAGSPRIPQWALPFRQPSSLASAECTIKGPVDLFPAEQKMEGRILHSSELPRLGLSPKELFKGRRVLIVGGGLTAAHLMLSAKRHQAASAVMISRNSLRVSEFCVDLKWVGRCRHLLLADFRSQSIPDRLHTLAKARPGGSITPCIKDQLMHVLKMEKGRITLMEGTEVKAIIPHGTKEWNVLLYNGQLRGSFDRIILATGKVIRCKGEREMIDMKHHTSNMNQSGHETDIRRDPLLSPLLDLSSAGACASSLHHHQHHNMTTSYACGLPFPDPSLRLIPSHEIYVMGPYAALQLGPDAGNLNGALMAARIISDEIRESRFQIDKQIKEKDRMRSQNDVNDQYEDIEDIHELNNPFDLLREDDEEDENEEEELKLILI